MPSLPASSDFTGGAVTEGQFKTALTALRDYLSGLLGADGVNATALATLGALGAGFVEKTATYTVTIADRGKCINCNGTFTLALPAASMAGAGFSLLLRVGAGSVTIDPDAAELVEGAASAVVPSGRACLLVCSGTGWATHWMSRSQATSTDTTPDRMMAVGAFGLGAGVATLTDLTAAVAPGLYGFAEATATGSPGTGNFSCTLLCMRVGPGGNFGFLAWRATTGIPKIWFGARTTITGAITWTELWTKQTAIGTVSQAAGVPTGAVLESGSNANGRYERRADGVQECWHSMVASAGAGVAWTFPAAFAEAPIVNGNAIATVASSVVLDAAPTTTAATISTRDKTDARRADTVQLHAVGRWSTMT